MDSDHILLVQSDHRMSYYVRAAGQPICRSCRVISRGHVAYTADWTTVQDSGSAFFSSDYMLQIVIRRLRRTTRAVAPHRVHVVLDCTIGRRTGAR